MQKALAFRNIENGSIFYFDRLATRRRPVLDFRKVVMVGQDKDGNKIELDPDRVLGKDAQYEYLGGRTWEE